MQQLQPLLAYPVSARLALNHQETILVGIFSDPNGETDCARFSATIDNKIWQHAIPAIIKYKGDLFYLYSSFCMDRPGEYQLKVSINGGAAGQLEMNCPLRVGNFKERLASGMVNDFAGDDRALLNYALQLIDSGASNADVAGELFYSVHAQRKAIVSLYEKYLHRGPYDREWPELFKMFQEEQGMDGVKSKLLASDEYFQQAAHKNNKDFIASVTNRLTGMTTELPDTGHWYQALEAGNTTREKVVTAIQESYLARYHAAAENFEQFSHRKPTAFDLKDIVNNIRLHKTGPDHLGITWNAPTLFIPPDQEPGKVPDYTFQFFLNLDQANSLAGGKDVRQVMLNAIKKVIDGLGPKYDEQLSRDLYITIADLIPNPEIESIPYDGQENGALWFDGGANEFSLKILDPMELGSSYTFILSAASIKRVMDTVWANYPKRLNRSGKPAANGDIELRDYELTLGDNKLSIRINATFHATDIIGIGVSLTYTDVFSLDASGNIVVQSSHKLNYDAGIDWMALITATAYLAIPLTFATMTLDVLKLRIPQLPDFSFGTILKGFFPTSIMVSGSDSKLVFAYNNNKIITSDRILLSGNGFPFFKRTPAVSLGDNIDVYYPDDFKPYLIVSHTGNHLVSLKFRFTVQTFDLRGNLQYTYSGDGLPSNQAGNTVDVTFQFDPSVHSQRKLSATVMDEDNLQASATVYLNFLAKPRRKEVPDKPGKKFPTIEQP